MLTWLVLALRLLPYMKMSVLEQVVVSVFVVSCKLLQVFATACDSVLFLLWVVITDHRLALLLGAEVAY